MSSPVWRRYLRFWSSDLRADLDDELRFHLESRVSDGVAAGMTPETARADALRRFGDVERVRRSCEEIDTLYEQEQKRADMWSAVLQDIRYAARALRRSPAFTIIAVLTLALGIGANTAIFSVVNGVLLQPLPYAASEQLVRVFTAFRANGVERYAVSQPEFMDYKGLTHVFENAAAYTGAGLTLTGGCGSRTGGCEPERVRGIAATRDFFPVLGIAPSRGRNFEGEDGRRGREPVVIVTHEFWRNRFGGDPALLGRSLTLNGTARRVVGILPPGVEFDRAEVFIPMYINPDSLTGRASNYLRVVARLRPNVTVEHAQRELNTLTRRSNEQYPNVYPASMGYGATAVGMRDELVGDVRPALFVLLGAVGLVLLIACANVANLLLARGEARQREIAVRLALGANRRRILLQLLTESSVLALVGAGVGVLLAWWGTKALLAVSPDSIPRLESVRIDATVGAVTLGLALLTGFLFGIAPALQMVRGNTHASLKDGSRGGSESSRRQRLGRALVTLEIALAVMVVIGAALLFQALRNVDAGFEPEHVLAVDLSVPSSRYDAQATTAFYQQLVARLASLPGVRVAAAASDLPPAAGGNNWDIEIAGRPPVPGQAAPSPHVRAVTSGYFTTLGVGLVGGRLFSSTDVGTSSPVAIVNETLARTVWPNANPIGQQIRFSPKMPWVTVVGVVRDVRSMGLSEPAPAELFVVHEQMPAIAGNTERTMYAVLRTERDPLTLAAPARRVVRELDPLLAITGVRSMPEMMELSVARPRFTMLLLSVFAVVAFTLAAIGVYGIMSYAVKRRTREIGIRMALGARPNDVLNLVVGQGMRLTLVGVALGIGGALLATRILTRLLYGVSATDPATFTAIAMLITAVAFAASWVPARRATRTDPTLALREE